MREATRLGAQVVVSTYNEPLITSEWAVSIFREAREAGLLTAFVSNGNGTPRVLDYIGPWIDLYKVDLKSFDDRHYRELGGRIEPILSTIRALHAMGLWLEIVTLLIPGFNDSQDEIERLTAFIAGVSPDIPWHVTAFHKDYRMNDPENTTPEMLVKRRGDRRDGMGCATSMREPAGPRGRFREHALPPCRALLVERYGYFIRGYRITADGHVSGLRHTIPGRWGAKFDGQIASSPFVPGTRRLRML